MDFGERKKLPNKLGVTKCGCEGVTKYNIKNLTQVNISFIAVSHV